VLPTRCFQWSLCCYFARKAAYGSFGSIFGLALGLFAGVVALRLFTQRSPWFGACALVIAPAVGLSALYGGAACRPVR
jgi:hypothetical protein